MSRACLHRCGSCHKYRPLTYTMHALLCTECVVLWQASAEPEPIDLSLEDSAIERLCEPLQLRRKEND